MSDLVVLARRPRTRVCRTRTQMRCSTRSVRAGPAARNFRDMCVVRMAQAAHRRGMGSSRQGGGRRDSGQGSQVRPGGDARPRDCSRCIFIRSRKRSIHGACPAEADVSEFLRGHGPGLAGDAAQRAAFEGAFQDASSSRLHLPMAADPHLRLEAHLGTFLRGGPVEQAGPLPHPLNVEQQVRIRMVRVVANHSRPAHAPGATGRSPSRPPPGAHP